MPEESLNAPVSVPGRRGRPAALGALGRWWRRGRVSRALRSSPLGAVGLAIVIGFLLIAFFPGLFSEGDPLKLSLRERLLPPSPQHWFGTDGLGMDIYTRVIYGARITLQVVLVVLLIAVSVGYLVGALAAYAGGWVDDVLMRITDVFLAFPNLVLAIAVNAALGRGLMQTMLAVGLVWWPSYARLIRSQVLSVKHEEYVVAAETIGGSPARVLVRHILPNCFDPVIVRITLDVGFVALTTAGLSFLGLGAEPPAPEWGRMVADGRANFLDQWWITTFPGLALFLVVVGFNLFGELIRDVLDPSSIDRP